MKIPLHTPISKIAMLFLVFFSAGFHECVGSAATQDSGSGKPTPILESTQTLDELRSYLRQYVLRFDMPGNPGDWLPRADKIRKEVLAEVILRGVPDTWLNLKQNIVWEETIPGDGYQIRKLRYEALPGLWIGALLYEPSRLDRKVPAVMNVNGHVGEPGMTIPYKQIRCINQAKRGFLALNLEWIWMGQLRTDGYAHNNLAYLDLCGVSGVSVFYLILQRGLDVLCAHPQTDLERVAVTGLSGGGWQTIMFSSLDTRVKLSAPNAGYIDLTNRIDFEADTGDLEQNPVDLLTAADYVQLTALLAPRPALLIYNIKDDCCFPSERAKKAVFEPIVPLYSLLGKPENFAFHTNYDPGTHNYEKDNRQAFYRFLNRHFLPESERIDEEIPVDKEVHTPQELHIEYPQSNADFYSLAGDIMKSLPANKRSHGDAVSLEKWRNETRNSLIAIVRPDWRSRVQEADGKSIPLEPIAGTAGFGKRYWVNNRWTLPVAAYDPQNPTPGITLIIADAGRSSVLPLMQAALARQERVRVVDLLFTGESKPKDIDDWKLAQLVSTVGRRPLGIQVSQLDAVLDWLHQTYPRQPVRVVAQGKTAGLAALVSAALTPGPMDSLQLHQMASSLKQLLSEKVSYDRYPSLFCFGLLSQVDISDLIDLAVPVFVEIRE